MATRILTRTLLSLELGRVLCEGLSQLPANQRELLMLLSDEQLYSYREIGEILAMPVGSIGPTRSRALTKLRESATIHDYFVDADGAQRQQPA